MHYNKAGNGFPLVLLHGFPDNSEIWADIYPSLQDKFTIIMPDLPGCGLTPLNGDTALADMARDIKNILDKEGITKAILAGHSMGGYTALAFARLYPGAVAGLSLIHSSALPDDEEKKQTRLKAIEIIRNGGKAAFIKQMTDKLFAPAFLVEHPEAIKRKYNVGMKVDEAGLINCYKAMIGRDDNTAITRDATFPIQWILGKQDAIINYRNILKECHQSDVNFVSLYNNCGHMIMIENPAALISDLREFVQYCIGRKPVTL